MGRLSRSPLLLMLFMLVGIASFAFATVVNYEGSPGVNQGYVVTMNDDCEQVLDYAHMAYYPATAVAGVFAGEDEAANPLLDNIASIGSEVALVNTNINAGPADGFTVLKCPCYNGLTVTYTYIGSPGQYASGILPKEHVLIHKAWMYHTEVPWFLPNNKLIAG